MISRRSFLYAGIAGSASLTFSSVWSQASPDLGTPTLPAVGYKRVTIGAAEVIALHDGAVRIPLREGFVTNAPIEQVKALLASQSLSTDHVEIPFTAFLAIIGGRKVLFDTGFADNGPPTAGRLQASLAAAGLKAEDIDTVVLSHFHGDHLSGLRNKAGQWVYPRAEVMVPAPEYAFWMSEEKMNAAPPAAKGNFELVRKVLGALPAERLKRFEPGTEILPGVKSVAAFGHTPGHTLFTVSSQGRSFAYVADLTNVPALFARAPDWSVQFDMDAEMARQTRRRVLEMLARDRMVAGGYHFPFPAFGNMETAGGGYQFKPVA